MPTHGYEALDAWTSRMPASSALLEPAFRHESNPVKGGLVRYGLAGAPRFSTDAARERWLADGMPLEPSRTDQRLREAWTFSYLPEGCGASSCAVVIPVADLPADPGPLAELLRAYASHLARTDGQDEAAAIFREVGDILAAPTASPELRAALFRVVARLDGVQLASGAERREVEALLASLGVKARPVVVALTARDAS